MAERLGARTLVLANTDLDDPSRVPATVGALREALAARWPELAGSTFRVSVSQRYAADGDPVSSHDEIALIPPVSGG